jgi:hypothetical protein
MYPSRSGAREARVTELEAVVTTGGRRMRRWSILIVIAFAFLPSTATAQFCFRGGAPRRCHSFLVTEFALGHRFTTPVGASPWVVQWELGAMVNQGEHSALGGSVTVGGTDPLRFGIKARYRYWLGSDAALDIAPGVLLHTSGASGIGFTGHVAITYGDWFGAGIQLETLPAGPARTLAAPRIQLGAHPGTIVGALVAVFGAVFVALGTST